MMSTSVHLLRLAGELVEGDRVPVPDEPDLPARVVHEELGNGDLAARDQDPVWDGQKRPKPK